MEIFTKAVWLAGTRNPEGCSFHVLSVGRLCVRTLKQPYRFGGYYCWHLIDSGHGFLTAGDQTFPLQKGDMFSVMRDSEILYGPADGSEWSFSYIRIDGEAAGTLTARIGFSDRIPVIPGGGKRVGHLFTDVVDKIFDGCRRPEYFASTLLTMVDRLEVESDPVSLNSKRLVENAKNLMSDPFHRHSNINEIASALCVNRVTLYKAFLKEAGIRPHDWLQQVRIDECRKLIVGNPTLTLDELRRISPFPNGKYFHRVFRKLTGETPGEFRNKIQEKLQSEKK